MAPRPAAVAFDAVGTLIHPEPSAAEVYAAVGRRHGSRLTVEEIRPRFAVAFTQQEAADQAGGLRTSEAREIRRWREIVAAVLDDVADKGACFQELYQHFARPDAWHVEPEAAAVLETLARRGRALALASNYDYRLRSVALGLPELRAARTLVISSEVGWRKPAPEFFAAVSSALRLPAERILFVGDDRANDFDGARAAGMRAVLFDPRGEVAGSVASLTELLDLLP
jgi:putative hydrolase of the HAD superfamily